MAELLAMMGIGGLEVGAGALGGATADMALGELATLGTGAVAPGLAAPSYSLLGGNALSNAFLTSGAGQAGRGLVSGIGNTLSPQSQMPPAPKLGLLSAPMASELGVPSYKRVQGSLVIPQGGPRIGSSVGSSDDLEKLVQSLRQRGLI
jgi:hypothetical protein